jgi:KDO2-lipid IV(A) lauroyltransferase
VATTTVGGTSGTAGSRPAAVRRGTFVQRIRVRFVAAGAAVVGLVPEGLALRVADLAGDLVHRRAHARRAQARRNLGRVAAWASANGVGSPALRAAATDGRALDRLVRSAFRHHARYWIELIRAPRMTAAYIRERVDFTDAAVLPDAIATPGPVLFVGLHLGAIEMLGFYAGQVAGRPANGPMETVVDPELSRWFLETRRTMGMRLVGLREARRELTAALRRGEIVGVVADRDLTGGGVPTTFFGHEAPLPAGPPLLLGEVPAATFAVAVRRTGMGRYAARVERLEVPTAAPGRRERVEAFLDAEARVFERFIVEAPEQWWAVFYPIWPDLEADAARAPETAP